MNKMPKHTVLLIDDDEKLASLLKSYFARFNIRLLSETLPSEGLKANLNEQPDLIILDVMLPEMDGFEVCRRLRKTCNTPIIMLTARELVARIDGILSRIDEKIPENEPDVFQVGDLLVNKSTFCVVIDGREVELTSKEFALLIMMTEKSGKVFTRDDIMNELGRIDGNMLSRSVDILVSRLRVKLKPLDYIETVWGVGYRFKEI